MLKMLKTVILKHGVYSDYTRKCEMASSMVYIRRMMRVYGWYLGYFTYDRKLLFYKPDGGSHFIVRVPYDPLEVIENDVEEVTISTEVELTVQTWTEFLNNAVAEENYEHAAYVRDAITRLMA